MNKIAAIIIWYNPTELSLDTLLQNMNSYASYFSKIYIIDNSKQSNKELSSLIKNSKYIHNNNINGIAGAQNKGCQEALKDGFKWAMTLDQDSFFKESEIKRYIYQFYEYVKTDDSIKSYSIKIKNNNNTISIIKKIQFNLLSPIKRKILGKYWHPRPINKNINNIEYPLEVIASGNIISLEAWKKVGGFDELLFIDEVDYDFCHKLLENNYKIIRFNNIYIDHFLGTKTISLFTKTYGYYNNFRLFYIYRNILIERFRYSKYKALYNKRLRIVLFDTLINSIHPISHLFVFIKAFLEYKKLKSHKTIYKI